MRKKEQARKGMQLRAENLKSLSEQRADLVQQMKELTGKAEAEKRAFTEEEDKQFDELDKQVKALDSTIGKLERARAMKLDGGQGNAGNGSGNEGEKEREKLEERAFEAYIRSECGLLPEERADGTEGSGASVPPRLDMGNNGAVIPVTIANRIITQVKDICPILSRATIYNVQGTLKVPVWGKMADGKEITVAYQTEFVDITESAGKFTSIDLSGYLAGALVLIGKSVANNAQVDVVSFVVDEMARKIAEFLEKELLIGTEGKACGALSVGNTITANGSSAISSDELITVQASVKQAFQKNACWIMNPDTFTMIRKLKDGNGRYLLQDDVTSEFPYRLLGKPVFVSDNMPKAAAGNKAVLYGDLSGLSVNMRENIQIQVLLEKYATQHAVGIVAWFEFDSKVTDAQRMVTLSMKAA